LNMNCSTKKKWGDKDRTNVEFQRLLLKFRGNCSGRPKGI
jgi:hypothetical protein